MSKDENINHELWTKIAEIIPYYQMTFGIDGAMIDMGHALPNQLKSEIIKKAININPGFVFWDENFDNKKETFEDGYNAVIGDTWYKITRRNGFKKMIKEGLVPQPLPYFGASETHNSPRLTNTKKKKAAWILFHILPQAIPFLHNGFELHEHMPVNTGLNFNQQQLDDLSHEKLALFYKASLNWESKNILDFMIKTAKLTVKYPWIFDGLDLELLKTSNKKVLGYHKKSVQQEAIILFNTNFHRKEHFSLPKSSFPGKYYELLTQDIVERVSPISMNAGQVIIGIK